ncbi:DUF6777 domain-containing protein [Streptomyces sp. NPDC004609]|uniref:DUF6777 domain-containing protein n=1 Tax=Streptomyces sp. NPDC004609 TaxID=3364704 RepID=UPI0036AA268B
MLVAILAGLGLMATGCAAPKVAVKAVTRGVPTAAPFFDAALGLGTDALTSKAPALDGGVKKGDRPGLYGGTRKRKSCAKDRLVAFLKDRANREKARQWADVLGIDTAGIEAFVKKLTPVVLRNDTLVENHDYKKGRAVAFDALLEAGIAVLVDTHGRPVVQCSCGNPLGSFGHDVDRADVRFEGTAGKWKAYDPGKVVKVEPTAEEEPVAAYVLVEVRKKDARLERPAGTEGAKDKPLPGVPSEDSEDSEHSEGTGGPSGGETTPGTVEVPDVRDTPLDEAIRLLEDRGFTVQLTGAPDGRVAEQSPGPGERAPEESAVTLVVTDPDSTSSTGPVDPPGTPDPDVSTGGPEDPPPADPPVTDPLVADPPMADRR